MKKLWKYLFKYKLLFFTRVLTISLAALSVICFDFMMGFIVDIFSNGETEKFVPIILASIFLIILLFVTEYIDGYVMSSYIKNTVNYLRCDIFTKILNKDMKDFSLDNSGKYISILYNDIKIIEDSLLNNIFLVISSFISFIISLLFLFSISPSIVIFIVILLLYDLINPPSLFSNFIGTIKYK